MAHRQVTELPSIGPGGNGGWVAGTRSFDELLTEGESVPVEGWDFSWLREGPPSSAHRGVTSSWPAATSGRWAAPVAVADNADLPFRAAVFDLVVSRAQAAGLVVADLRQGGAAYRVQRRRRGRALSAQGHLDCPRLTVERYRDRLAELLSTFNGTAPSWPTHSASPSKPAS